MIHDDTLVVAGTGYDSNLGERYFGVKYNVDKNSGELIRKWHYAEAANAAKSNKMNNLRDTNSITQ